MFLGLVRSDVPWHYLVGTTQKCRACQRIWSSEDRSMSSEELCWQSSSVQEQAEKIRRFLAHACVLCRFRSIFFAPVAVRSVRWCFQPGEVHKSRLRRDFVLQSYAVRCHCANCLVATICSCNTNGTMILAWML